jgi:hypothetical protein
MSVLRTESAAMIVGKGLQQMLSECAALDLEGKKIIPFLNSKEKIVEDLITSAGYLDYKMKEIYKVYMAVINETLEMDEKEKFPKKDETLKLAE